VNEESAPVLQRAEKELRSANIWWKQFWVLHGWLSALAIVISVVILVLGTLLLYLPEKDRLDVNKLIIGLSGLGLIFQIITSTQRLKERAIRHRRRAVYLDTALTEFRAGLLPFQKLNEVLRRSLTETIDEEGP
jgi:hypothetical protein